MALVNGTDENGAYIGDGSDNACNGYQDKCNNKGTILEIPSKIGDNYVYEIKRCAFHYCSYIQVLIFHEPLKIIGTRAFHLCRNIHHVTIPKTVTTLCSSCFDDYYSLERVDFDVGSKLETIQSYAFNTAKKLAYINIPSSVKTIEYGAFSEIEAHLNIYYCGKKKFEKTNNPFDSTNDYSIIVPFGGVPSFLGKKTINGFATCEIANIIHSCVIKKRSYSNVFAAIVLFS